MAHTWSKAYLAFRVFSNEDERQIWRRWLNGLMVYEEGGFLSFKVLYL